jgi:nucleotide-binding universal stress UspA family protein
MSEKMVDLVTMANESEARYIASVLEAEGISTLVNPVPGLSGTMAMVMGAGLPHVVRVMADRYEDGQEVINRAREDSIDIDWDEIDVGEPEDETAREIAEREDTA